MFDAEGHKGLNAKTSLAFGCVNILISVTANKCAARSWELEPKNRRTKGKAAAVAATSPCIPYPVVRTPSSVSAMWTMVDRNTFVPLLPLLASLQNMAKTSADVGHTMLWICSFNFNRKTDVGDVINCGSGWQPKNRTRRGNNQVRSDLIWLFLFRSSHSRLTLPSPGSRERTAGVLGQCMKSEAFVHFCCSL